MWCFGKSSLDFMRLYFFFIQTLNLVILASFESLRDIESIHIFLEAMGGYDLVIENTNQLALLSQQLIMTQLANEHQRRVTTKVRGQVWQPYASMDYVQCGGTPYWNNYNSDWQHCPNTSWNTSYTTPHTP